MGSAERLEEWIVSLTGCQQKDWCWNGSFIGRLMMASLVTPEGHALTEAAVNLCLSTRPGVTQEVERKDQSVFEHEARGDTGSGKKGSICV